MRRKHYTFWLLCNNTGESFQLEDAPIGWDDNKINIIRDFLYLGIIKTLSIEFEFVGDGFDILQNRRLRFGIDFNMVLRIYETVPNRWLFDGKVNTQNYREEREVKKFRVDIVESSFVQKWHNREDVKLNVLNTISMDRNAIDPAFLRPATFRGKQIKFESEFSGTTLVEPEVYHHVLPFKIVNNGNPGVQPVGNILAGTWDEEGDLTFTPEQNPLIDRLNAHYVNVLSEPQTIVVDALWSYSLVYQGIALGPNDHNYVDYKILHCNADGSIKEVLLYNRIQLDSGISNGTINYSDTLTLEPNEFIMFLCEKWQKLAIIVFDTPQDIDVLDSDLKTEITYNQMSLTITQDSVISDTVHQVILPHELFTNLVKQINGGRFYSEVFGRTDLGYDYDGEHAYLGITIGELLRGIDPSLVQISMSFRDAFKSYSSVACLGAIIQGDLIRVDPLDMLFSNEIVADIGEVSDLSINPLKEFLFNSVKAGYPSNEYEQENGRDEPNTPYEYTNSLEAVKRPLDIMSAFYGDGYGIEFARRASVANTGTQDSRYDGKIFLIDLIPVEDPEDGAPDLQTRRLEGILDVDGIFSEETAMNLRIAVGQNMLRWRKYLTIPLDKKDKIYYYQTKEKNNQFEVVTELGSSIDGQDLQVGNQSYFLPEDRQFNCPIELDTLVDILANPLGLIKYSYKGEDFFDFLCEVDSEAEKHKSEWRMFGTRSTPVEVSTPDEEILAPIIKYGPGQREFIKYGSGAHPYVLYGAEEEEAEGILDEDLSPILDEDGNPILEG